MNTVRRIVFCLALVAALSGMDGFVYAKTDTDSLSAGRAGSAETEAAPLEETSGEDAAAEESAEEPQQESAQETEAAPLAEISGEDAAAEESGEEPEQESGEETGRAESGTAAEDLIPLTAAEMLPEETALTQLEITWDEDTTVQFIVKHALKWNAAALCWETDDEQDGEVSLSEDSSRKTFTVRNGSDETLTATVSFTPDKNLPEVLQDAYEEVSFSCDPIPAGETVSGTATVIFNFDGVHFTDEEVTEGTLGSFTIQLTPEEGSGEDETDETDEPDPPEASPSGYTRSRLRKKM